MSRRRRPRLSTAAAVVSLALCLAAAVLWVRSYRTCDVLLRQRAHGDRWCATSEFGLLVLELEAAPVDRGRLRPTWVYFDTTLPRRWPPNWRWLGFDAYRGGNTHYVRLPPTPLWGVQVPHWAAVLLAAALPGRRLTVTLARSRALRRARRGLCASCGYDLRASLGRCPECGTGRRGDDRMTG